MCLRGTKVHKVLTGTIQCVAPPSVPCSTLQTGVNPLFPSTKMLKKLTQRRRRYSIWRWAGCQGQATRLLARRLEWHPTHLHLQSTDSPLQTAGHPQFPSTQMLNKLKQRRRKNSSSIGVFQGWTMRLLERGLARRPARHHLHNTTPTAPLQTTIPPPPPLPST